MAGKLFFAFMVSVLFGMTARAQDMPMQPGEENNADAPRVVYAGDSLTAGFGGTHPYPYYITLPAWQGRAVVSVNTAVNGLQAGEIFRGLQRYIEPYYSRSAGLNILVVWAGTNDIAWDHTPGETFAYLQKLCRQAQKNGFKVLVLTMISRIDRDPGKDLYNRLIRARWHEFADGVIDVAANRNLGGKDAYENTVYFNSDGVHLNDKGYMLVGRIVQAKLADFIKKQ